MLLIIGMILLIIFILLIALSSIKIIKHKRCRAQRASTPF